MTSTDLVQHEIRRFLSSPEPEVLCVTGEWGVGKTYTWQKVLDEASGTRSIALKRYSYASLFGINSLDGLKLALFENLDILDAPPLTTFQQGVHGITFLFARAKKLSGIASAIPLVGPALAKAGPLYFSLIRHQFVCIDDLERRGSGLEIKDVFGLVSFLREQRNCKVILLLNSDALGESRAEFDTYFEKVIDARLIFAPTAAEAVAIALTKNDRSTEILKTSCELLGVSNIRVIKKIERLVRQIEPILSRFAAQVMESAVRAVTLFGWSKFQPGIAPPMSYVRVGGMERHMTRKKSQEVSPQEQAWDTTLARYEFTHLDDLDRELWKFVDTGILDPKAVEARAQEVDHQLSLSKQSGSFSQAWEPFHNSFDNDVELVVRSIVDGAKTNFRVVSISNLNETLKILRELSRDSDAKEVLDYFATKQPDSFWERGEPFFLTGPLEEDIQSIIDDRESKKQKPFVPDVELVEAARTYDPDKIKKLAKLPVGEIYQMLKSKKGNELKTFVLAALDFRRIANASDEMREVIRRMELALQKIASESTLNAIRVRKYGVRI